MSIYQGMKNIYLTCYSYSCDKLILQETKLLLNSSANISRNTLYSVSKSFKSVETVRNEKYLPRWMHQSEMHLKIWIFLQPKFQWHTWILWMYGFLILCHRWFSMYFFAIVYTWIVAWVHLVGIFILSTCRQWKPKRWQTM